MAATEDNRRRLEDSGDGAWRDSEFLDTKQAAAFAGNIGVSTIRQACNLNELRHIRIGGSTTGPIRTTKEWVREWLKGWARGKQGTAA